MDAMHSQRTHAMHDMSSTNATHTYQRTLASEIRLMRVSFEQWVEDAMRLTGADRETVISGFVALLDARPRERGH